MSSRVNSCETPGLGLSHLGQSSAENSRLSAVSSTSAKKTAELWKGRALTETLSLTRLSVKNKTLLNKKKPTAIDKLPQKEREDLLKEITEFITEAIKREDIQKLISENGGKFKFSLNEKEGFILRFGKNKIKLGEYSDFLILEDPDLNMSSIEVFKKRCKECLSWKKVEKTQSQMLFKAVNRTADYVEKAMIDRVSVKKKPDSTDKKIVAIFDKTTKLIKNENDELSKSWWARHEGKWLNASNIFSLGANAFSSSPSLISGILDFGRSLCFAVYKSVVAMKGWGVEGKEGIYKNTFFERAFIVVGFLYSLGIFVLGLLLSLESFLSEFVKATLFYTSYIFSYVFATPWALWNIINFGSQEKRIIELRKELNSFLENDNLNEKEKFRGYLAHLEKTIKLTPEEINKIKEQTQKTEKNELASKLKKENPEVTQEEIDRKFNESSAFVSEKIEKALHQENRYKIEKLIMMTSGDIVESLTKINELIDVLDLGGSSGAEFNKALEKARELIAKIDQASYQNECTNSSYKWLGVICLIATVLFASLGTGGAAVLAALIVWSIISLAYILIDCEWTNQKIMSLVYFFRGEEEKSYKHLGIKTRTTREFFQKTTGWEWLKEKNEEQGRRKVEAVVHPLVSRVA